MTKKRINRTKAEDIISRFLERVQEVNSRDEFGYYVKKVGVFGSYTNKTAHTFGDIDVMVELKIREVSGRGNVAEYSRQRARDSGKIMSSFIQELYYSRHEVMLFLKSRSRYLSIHPEHDGIFVEGEVTPKIIYRHQTHK